MPSAKDIFSYKPFWAKRLTPAPFLPMSRDEMEALREGIAGLERALRDLEDGGSRPKPRKRKANTTTRRRQAEG